jgi:PhzF family phenazine biosynthesis protein
MKLPIYLVDAFADRPFTGNPAGVCLVSVPVDDDRMQQIAAEMNQAETAFLTKRADGDWRLRWFTPTVEVDLCGHATLASAHTLWETGRVSPGVPIRFHTRSGLLTCTQADRRIVMDFPAEGIHKSEVPQELVLGLGCPIEFVGRNRMDYLVEVESAEQVVDLKPDLQWIAQVPCRGVIVTARSQDDSCDFVSRFFAPQSGVAEDPVTGSAHCALGPYWMPHLGRAELVGYQASKRGGYVRVTCTGDRVLLGGSAVTVISGETQID